MLLFKSTIISEGELGPAMSDLANQVAIVIPHQWMRVAIQLELSEGVIQAIQRDQHGVFDKFMAVMYISVEAIAQQTIYMANANLCP